MELATQTTPQTGQGLQKLTVSGLVPNALAGLPQQANGAQADCQHCGGIGYISVWQDGSNRAKRCECLKAAVKARKLAAIPREYRDKWLAKTGPDANRHEIQPALWQAMREKPQGSFVLCGRNGCGKTLAGWMLYREAVEASRLATGLGCVELVDQFRQWQFDEFKLPAITPFELKSGERRMIFIDEIDKARPSEFAAETLFQLFDAIYANHHQLVVTSNTPLAGLADHWARGGVTMGPSIVRRLMDGHDAVLVEMF